MRGLAALMSACVLAGGEWREGLSYEKQVIPIPDRVAADPLAIGYSGVAYIKPGVAVKRLAISQTRERPFLSGTFEEVASQTYPLARVMYFYVNRPPGKDLDLRIRELIRYILSREGQRAVVQDGIYTPLRARMLRASLEKLH